MIDVSVIIPNYNCAKWLPLTIGSCFNNYNSIEVIVVDDKSTDNSLEVLNELKQVYNDRLIIVENQLKGGNSARNLGFKFSKGEYIQWLDADDILLKNKLITQIQYFESNSNVDIVYSDWKITFFNSNLEKIKEELKYCECSDDYLAKLLRDEWSPSHSYLLRRRIATKLDQIEAWSPLTQIGQDREYFTIAALLGATYGYVPGIFAQYNKWSSKSVSSDRSDLKYVTLWRLYDRFDAILEESSLKEIKENKVYKDLLYTNRLVVLYFLPSYRKELLSIINRKLYFTNVRNGRVKLFVIAAHLFCKCYNLINKKM